MRGSAKARLGDRRLFAAMITVSALLVGGASLAWIGTLTSRPAVQPVEPDPRLQPREHGDARRQAEIKVRFTQGVAMLHAKQHEHALTAFHRVLELAPQMPEAHVNMGFALIGLGRFEAARSFFESAAALRPQQVNAYYGLAVALEGLGDVPGAIGAMRTYAHLAPKDDPYARKAQAALWEWESRVGQQRASR